MVRTALAIALLTFAGAASAQDQRIPSPGSGQPAGAIPGGVPAMPVANPANPQAAFQKLPANLQAHLLAWEKRTSGLQTLYTACEREVTNTLMKKTVNYTGTIYCMKPNLARLRIDNTVKKEDYQAYICDGKFVYEYSGPDKVVVQHPIPPGGKGNVGDNLLLEFMSGAMTAADTAQRFNLALIKEDEYYVYLEVKPILPKDQGEFETMILVLYGAKVKGMDYLPAKVRMTKDNSQLVEEWTFKQPMPNAAGIKAADFNYIPPPKDWQVKSANGLPNKVRP